MKQFFLYSIIMALFLGGSLAVSAMERFDVVITHQLKRMLDERSLNKTEFILVNALDEIAFRDSSIPGSINLPWGKVNEMSSKLGENKERLIITY